MELSIAAVLVGIFLLFIIGNPKVFTRFDIYYSFMSTIPFFGIMALAMTLVVTLGEMDLSFPSVLALSALVFGKIFMVTGNIWLAVLACLMIGLAAGALNAVLIVRVGIPSLVATIGTMFFFRRCDSSPGSLDAGFGHCILAAVKPASIRFPHSFRW